MYSYVFPFYSLQFFVPDESAVNKDFIKDVLAGKKNLLKKSEVQHINVKRYDELSVKAMYPMFKKRRRDDAVLPGQVLNRKRSTS